ncbi:hypothetical protein QAD02_001566 [Eretmocerus hayati]|uniref:Uncharacterized protein n=1 Tax=Eretmocerus hayati TaxID=131215 RepID=A0ACC2NGT9_9HYME|nr:hypothetical protein QAD02_001566 [Eretmocerus hayati]
MFKILSFCIIQLATTGVQNILFCNAEPITGVSSAAARYEHLFIVYIKILCENCLEGSDQGSDSPSSSCVGTLITKRHVLTLAGCLSGKEPSEIQVLGSDNNSDLIDVYGVHSWTTYGKWISQNKHSGPKAWHNLAIIRLLKYVSPTKMKPAYLSIETNEKYYNKEAFIAGWRDLALDDINQRRRTPSLHTATVQIIDRNECRIRKQELKEIVPQSEETLCTKSTPYSLLGCGDDGSPLLSKDRKAVLAVGTENCLHNLPISLYNARVNSHANIYYYKDFIVDATAGEKLSILGA